MSAPQPIAGGVCAPRGFTANGIHCGIRKNRTKPDLALICSQVPAAAAAVYTRNRVKGAPLLVTRQHLQNNTASAVICNSGNANTCNANGEAIAEAMCALVAEQCRLPANDILVASTGVIGVPLPLAPLQAGIPSLVAGLSAKNNALAAQAILTTDTFSKESAVAFSLQGVVCHIGGMAKGSGMIHPNMATMLAFCTSDVAIEPTLLQSILARVTDATFNMVSVDGDTSTNDMCCLLCNGMAGNTRITAANQDDAAIFENALRHVLTDLAKMLAKDGEGATKLLECTVQGAATTQEARQAAKAVISSSLLKAAMCGADANWGRVLCALGYAGVPFALSEVQVEFSSAAGTLCVCQKGAGLPFDESVAKGVLSEPEIQINIRLGQGTGQATAWGCDLTCEYVKINGDYRT